MTDLLTRALFRLCTFPEIVPRLRDEFLRVVAKFGMANYALNEAHLLNSFVKKTQ